MINNKNRSFSLEERLFKIKLFWFSLLITLLLFFTILFILNFLLPIYKASPPPTHADSIGPNNSTQFNLLQGLNILYIFCIIFSIIIVQTAKLIQNNKVVNEYFTSLDILRTHHLNGVATLHKELSVEIIWSKKSYFILKQNNREIAFAKSSELYWKLLFLKQNLLIGKIKKEIS